MMIHVLRNISGRLDVPPAHYRLKEVVLLVPDDAAFHHLLGVAAGHLTFRLANSCCPMFRNWNQSEQNSESCRWKNQRFALSQPPRTTGLSVREGKGVFSSTSS